MCDDDDNDGDVRFKMCAVIYMSFLCANLYNFNFVFKVSHITSSHCVTVSSIFRAFAVATF